MSLYDDLETEKTAPSGWASGLKLMPNQRAFKKATSAGVSTNLFSLLFVLIYDECVKLC